MHSLYTAWLTIQGLEKEACNLFKEGFASIEGISVVGTDINNVGITVLYKTQHTHHATYESMQYTYAYLLDSYHSKDEEIDSGQ